MIFLKNTAGQSIAVPVVNATTGGTMTGTTGFAGYRILDSGAQAALTGTFTDNSNGQYTFTFSQADINGDICKYLFTMTGMVPWAVTILTSPSVLVTSGTGTDQLSLSSGKVLLQATQTGVTIPTVTTVTTTTNLTNLPAVPTDWLAAAGVKADAVTKIQSGLATPTNITAGTITTVTSVTNPVSLTGDLTATMKTSVTTAANAATPIAASVSGSVGSVIGNVGGSVASVTAGVTVSTNNDKTGYALATSPPTAASIATAVLTDVANQTTAGSLGKLAALLTTALNGTSVFTTAALANAPTGGTAPTAAQIATAIFQDLTSSSDFTTVGSIGKLLVTNIDTTISSASIMDMTQAVPNTNTAGTVGDVLNSARAQAFGSWVITGNVLTLKNKDGSNAHVFDLTVDSDDKVIGRTER